MARSRHVLRLFFAAVFALVFATAGWCGGPFGLTGLGEADQGGLVIGGGFGRGTTFEGATGQTPGSDLRILGVYTGYTNYGRLKYDPFELKSLSFTFTWDYYYSMAHGSSYYAGPPHPVIGPGDTIDSQFFVALNALSLDIGVASLCGGGSRIAGGPRLQFAVYGDNLQISDADAGTDIVTSTGYSMFGLGFWGSIDLASVTGLDWISERVVLKPRLIGAAAFGGGGGMTYWEWEVFLRVLRTGGNLYAGSSVSVGPLAVELGYAKYTFAQRLGGSTSDGARLTMGIPLIRVSVPISF